MLFRSVINDCFGLAFSQHLPLTNDISPIADSKRLTHIMIRNQHTNLTFTQESNHLLNIDNGNRIDTRKWFVQQNETGLRCQCTRYLNAATLPAESTMAAWTSANRHGLAAASLAPIAPRWAGAARREVISATTAITSSSMPR